MMDEMRPIFLINKCLTYLSLFFFDVPWLQQFFFTTFTAITFLSVTRCWWHFINKRFPFFLFIHRRNDEDDRLIVCVLLRNVPPVFKCCRLDLRIFKWPNCTSIRHHTLLSFFPFKFMTQRPEKIAYVCMRRAKHRRTSTIEEIRFYVGPYFLGCKWRTFYMRVCLLCSAPLYCAYAYYPTPNHQ